MFKQSDMEGSFQIGENMGSSIKDLERIVCFLGIIIQMDKKLNVRW
jgi:hypothetical protein